MQIGAQNSSRPNTGKHWLSAYRDEMHWFNATALTAGDRSSSTPHPSTNTHNKMLSEKHTHSNKHARAASARVASQSLPLHNVHSRSHPSYYMNSDARTSRPDQHTSDRPFPKPLSSTGYQVIDQSQDTRCGGEAVGVSNDEEANSSDSGDDHVRCLSCPAGRTTTTHD